jgi:hypothetical protein
MLDGALYGRDRIGAIHSLDADRFSKWAAAGAARLGAS